VQPKGGTYLGEPPTNVPATQAGFVHPYILIWPNLGSPVDEQNVASQFTNSATTTTFQITVVAANQMAVMIEGNKLSTLLTDMTFGGRLIKPDVIANRAATILKDDTIRPARYYTATTWETTIQGETTS